MYSCNCKYIKINSIQFNSIIFNMFLIMCTLNSTKHKNNKITQKQDIKQNYNNKYSNSKVIDCKLRTGTKFKPWRTLNISLEKNTN